MKGEEKTKRFTRGRSVMKISINGKSGEYSGLPVLGELLRSLGVDPQKVAVERNLKVVPRSLMECEPVEAGDEFEIIRLVGGG
jgi:thiazole synthase